MKKLLSIILGASVAMLTGCGGQSAAPDNQATVLEFSQHGGIEDQSEEYYHNQADFQAEWDKLHANVSKSSLPNIDFTKNTVVVYTMGQQKIGGYQIRVLRALPIQNGYAVGLQVTIPGLGCHNETNEKTKPYIVVSVPTTMDPVFDEVDQRHQPSCTQK